ncbi:MAG: zinc metallopeptidase [Caldilineaceae bacterium]|nr:zinc metallopeptidase [Caldilineaceae bacterium]
MTFNPMYLLIIGSALLAWYAQARVRQVHEKYAAVENSRAISGQDAARALLAFHKLVDVKVERTPGLYTDHYDPQANVLRLSDGVANGRSLTALGIVAHEVGHAIQDAEGYRFMRIRTFLAQRVGTMTQWSSLIFVGGMLFGIPSLMGLGGLLLAGLAIFSLVTLPVERNASDRALASLNAAGLAAAEELDPVRQVLGAAAFTYLAALGQRLATFLFFAVVVAAARGLW